MATEQQMREMGDQIDGVKRANPWDGLKYMERAALLEREVGWDGFDAGDRFDVIENVLRGKDRSGWLDGIPTTEEKTAREDAIWAEAARRGNGSPNSEPYFRRDGIGAAQDFIAALKRTEDFVRLDDGHVVSEWLDRPEGDFTRLGSWDRLEERDKLAAVMVSDATEMLGGDDIRALLTREIDFTRVPRDAQREWLGEVYHDAREDKAELRSSEMAESHEDRGRADRLAEFSAWIEEWRRKGADSEGAKSTEEEKLRKLFWESCTVSNGFTVPGADVLAAIERNVDYAGLPAVQREMLEELRARLDARQFDGPQAEQRDVVGPVLSQAVDAGFFEESLRIAKESQERPWAEIPEDRKVRQLIEMARDSGAWVDWDFDGTTPGTHVLDTIEREVDYAKLSPWRREGLERLRDQVDREELAGEKPYAADRSDRAGYALRTTELEAIIQDYRHFGDTAQRPVQLPWAELREEEKLDRLERAIGFLNLVGESKTVDIINREVDLASVPEDRRRAIEETGAFDRVVADLPRRWHEDGHGDGMETWDDQSDLEKIGYLAGYAVKHEAPYWRFLDAAGRILGLEPGQEFTRDELHELGRQFRWARGDFSADGPARAIRSRHGPGRSGANIRSGISRITHKPCSISFAELPIRPFPKLIRGWRPWRRIASIRSSP